MLLNVVVQAVGHGAGASSDVALFGVAVPQGIAVLEGAVVLRDIVVLRGIGSLRLVRWYPKKWGGFCFRAIVFGVSCKDSAEATEPMPLNSMP